MRYLLPLLLAACADKADPADTGTSAEDYAPACLYGFRADVRSGPDAGVAVTGTLLGVGDDSDAGAALLATGGERAFDVPMDTDGSSVDLTFSLSAGDIRGSGEMDASVADCSGGMIGDLTGPAEGDAGDWAGEAVSDVPWLETDVPTLDYYESCIFSFSYADDASTWSGMMVLPDPATSGRSSGYIAADDGTALAAVLTEDGAGGYALRMYDDGAMDVTAAVSLSGSFSDCTVSFSGGDADLQAPALRVDAAFSDTAKMQVSGIGRTGVVTTASPSRTGTVGAPKKSFASKLGTF